MAVKKALVTGASHGIGLEVTRMLLAEGWSVLGVSRTLPYLWDEDGRYSWIQADVSDPMAMTWVQRHLPAKLDALVHCAAIQGPIGPFLDAEPAEWVQTINTNLIGTYNVVRAALPALQQSEDSRILLFAGGGAFNSRANYSAYAVSKAGVVSLMETLAEELRETSVTVNCVSPGFVPTGIDPHAPVLARDPDGSIAMQRAVACVRHLLGPQTRGLRGKTISAEYDDWSSVVDVATVAALNASVQGTRHRHTIQQVSQLRGVA